MMNYQTDRKTKTNKQTNQLISDLLQSYFLFNYYFKLNFACFVLAFLGGGGGGESDGVSSGEQVTNWH